MKLNNIMMAAVVAFGMSSSAFAAEVKDQGHGKVTFTGSIIDAPCSINPDSVDQTVELGQISKTMLLNGGQSTPRNFSIDLENCSFVEATGGGLEKNKVALTFTGMKSQGNEKLLGITGNAKGAGVAITDGSGALIELGKATKQQELQNGNNTLSFAAYLQADKASGANITVGDFQAVADFTLAYN